MPHLYKRKARKDIWKIGVVMSAINKQGFITDRSHPSVVEKDQLLIPKGSEYYTWHSKGCDWQYSLTKPDLTKPKTEWEEKFEDFKSRVIQIDDKNYEDLSSEIEEYQAELQNRLDNMPQQLQESSVLNERIDELQNLIESIPTYD